MKERPILFSGPMVRAILDGRKTQTRRVITNGTPYVNTPGEPLYFNEKAKAPRGGFGPSYATAWCPYGQPGDRLWVRETFGEDYTGLTEVRGQTIDKAASVYRADGHKMSDVGTGWKPSIHMPRWASRITLEVTSVRVERVQDISEEDAQAEGAQQYDPTAYFTVGEMGRDNIRDFEYRAGFASLWDSINSARGFGWEKNPWVWVVTFKTL